MQSLHQGFPFLDFGTGNLKLFNLSLCFYEYDTHHQTICIVVCKFPVSRKIYVGIPGNFFTLTFRIGTCEARLEPDSAQIFCFRCWNVMSSYKLQMLYFVTPEQQYLVRDYFFIIFFFSF